MPVEKFSISLPGDLVIEVDAIASAEGLSRSAVIRDATAAYVTRRQSAAGEMARRSQLDEALAGFDAVAQSWGPDSTDSLGYLRLVRGESGVPDSVMRPDE